MIWYTSMSLTDFPKIIGAFEKTDAVRQDQSQPFIAVRRSCRRSTPKRAPDVTAVDVVGSAPMEMWELKQRGYSAAYLSPELKAFPAGCLRSARAIGRRPK